VHRVDMIPPQGCILARGEEPMTALNLGEFLCGASSRAGRNLIQAKKSGARSRCTLARGEESNEWLQAILPLGVHPHAQGKPAP
jgi:hypothetical protein